MTSMFSLARFMVIAENTYLLQPFAEIDNVQQCVLETVQRVHYMSNERLTAKMITCLITFVHLNRNFIFEYVSYISYYYAIVTNYTYCSRFFYKKQHVANIQAHANFVRVVWSSGHLQKPSAPFDEDDAVSQIQYSKFVKRW